MTQGRFIIIKFINNETNITTFTTNIIKYQATPISVPQRTFVHILYISEVTFPTALLTSHEKNKVQLTFKSQNSY